MRAQKWDLPGDFCNVFSGSSSGEEKRNSGFVVFPGVSLVVVLELRAVLPNIGQSVGSAFTIIPNGTVFFFYCVTTSPSFRSFGDDQAQDSLAKSNPG